MEIVYVIWELLFGLFAQTCCIFQMLGLYMVVAIEVLSSSVFRWNILLLFYWIRWSKHSIESIFYGLVSILHSARNILEIFKVSFKVLLHWAIWSFKNRMSLGWGELKSNWSMLVLQIRSSINNNISTKISEFISGICTQKLSLKLILIKSLLK